MRNIPTRMPYDRCLILLKENEECIRDAPAMLQTPNLSEFDALILEVRYRQSLAEMPPLRKNLRRR